MISRDASSLWNTFDCHQKTISSSSPPDGPKAGNCPYETPHDSYFVPSILCNMMYKLRINCIYTYLYILQLRLWKHASRHAKKKLLNDETVQDHLKTWPQRAKTCMLSTAVFLQQVIRLYRPHFEICIQPPRFWSGSLVMPMWTDPTAIGSARGLRIWPLGQLQLSNHQPGWNGKTLEHLELTISAVWGRSLILNPHSSVLT